MKKITGFIVAGLLITISVILIGQSCSRNIIIDMAENLETRSDTGYTESPDSSDRADTLVPITFIVSVDDWEDVELD